MESRRMDRWTSEEVWKILEEVKDPEIPVISVVELGIIRQVAVEGEKVIVDMVPTFSGCPALQMMKDEILARMHEAGAADVEVRIRLDPPWSSDRITPAGRGKLKAFGLAPPARHGGDFQRVLLEVAPCPRCHSHNTSLRNAFGSTLCRAIFVCNECHEPFEQFKPI